MSLFSHVTTNNDIIKLILERKPYMNHLSKYIRIFLIIVAVFLLSQSNANSVWADTIGERHTFFVDSSYDVTGRTSIPATLEYVGVHSYFYVDDLYLSSLNSRERAIFNQQIIASAQEFDDNIYPKGTAFWGSETNPGIDNDPKVTILLERLTTGTGGYFDSANGYSKSQTDFTNQREMITANISSLNTGYLKIFLAHEFQHLISANQKEILRNVFEDTWLNELRSQYAITVAGYNDDFQNSDLLQRAQTFVNNPTDSLTEWPNTNLDYASVTLFGQYLVDRFGPGILQDTLRSPFVGINSIDKYLSDHQNLERFNDVFADWEWTNYFDNCIPDIRYCYVNQNLQAIHVSLTDNEQLTSNNPNPYVYLLKPWQSSWYQFKIDPSAPAGQNIKISWPSSVFQVYYADASGAERRLGNGDVITLPPAGSFILMPINSSKTSSFGASEASTQLSLSIEYTTQTLTSLVTTVSDGSLIMHAGTPDIYVVTGTYKRYLAPDVLKFYGLDASQAVMVTEAVFQSYMPANYIRAVDEKKVYAVWPDGTKHWLNMTAQHFTDSYRDWNSVFIVNSLESNFYKIGSDITQ